MFAYHFLNAGSVIGSYNQLSITSGYAKRIEFGYMRSIHAGGSNAAHSPLWTDGFGIFHAKGWLIKENAWKQPWMPPVSTGFMLRTQARNVGGQMQNKDTTNADIDLVATKTTGLLDLAGASGDETAALKRNTVRPLQDFIVLPLDAQTVGRIMDAGGLCRGAFCTSR